MENKERIKQEEEIFDKKRIVNQRIRKKEEDRERARHRDYRWKKLGE